MTDSERDRLWAIIHRLQTDRATVTLTRYEARELADLLRKQLASKNDEGTDG